MEVTHQNSNECKAIMLSVQRRHALNVFEGAQFHNPMNMLMFSEVVTTNHLLWLLLELPPLF